MKQPHDVEAIKARVTTEGFSFEYLNGQPDFLALLVQGGGMPGQSILAGSAYHNRLRKENPGFSFRTGFFAGTLLSHRFARYLPWATRR
ncbi:hypothetical protein [Hymenobacter sp. UYCo722]|uniref:hypothetical protein n=1 Tax=Hymenobacter sp. UYCo722 TaxID=3156335 RepID=UPI00339447A9